MKPPPATESAARARVDAPPTPAPRAVGRNLIACPACNKRFKGLAKYDAHYRTWHTPRPRR
jgi:hypothetical protein